MNEQYEEKNSKGPLIYAIIGICTLIIAVVGATYAYYAASVTAEIGGTAGGGEGPSLTIAEASSIENTPLIPVDMDTETLTNAALGWDSTLNSGAGGVGSGWNATRACKDMNGYASCKIYSVILTNNSSSTVSYKIGVTALAGTETPDNVPNIEAVAMGTSNTAVTDATSIVGDDDGIAANVQLAGGASSTTFYFMVLIENLPTPQADSGSFTGTITAVGGDGGRIEAQFD